MGLRRLGGLAGLAALIAAGNAQAATIEVEIKNLAFVPARITAHVGDTVEWINDDFLGHTATARDKAWDVTVPAHGRAQMTLTSAGDIDYYCRFHPNMVGHIKVEP